MNVHERIAREIWEEKRGLTSELRHKFRRLPRAGSRPRKITPTEYRAIIEVFGDADEEGKGFFEYEGRPIAYAPYKIWRF